jgi:hypothetical protein
MNSSTVICPTCGSRMESKTVRQLFSIWTAGENEIEMEHGSLQTVERQVALMRCSVCGYEEYELPEH